jgi:putative membrane protein
VIEIIRTLAGGFLMGTADLVPGVSGGTIALVLGIYERLVFSVREGSSALGAALKADLSRTRHHLGQVEWGFIGPLLVGILTAVFVLSGVLERQLEERPVLLAGLFLGLVLGSVVIAWRLVHEQRGVHVVVALVVAVALFLVLGAGAGRIPESPSVPVFFGAGAIAICAMILPGISGSLILVLVGMYAPVLGAVNDRNLTPVLVFVAGAVVGLALFSQILYWALRRHHDLVMAGLVGLMAGSTRILWPWPDGLTGPELGAPAEDWPVVALAMALGAVAVAAISRLAETREEEFSELQRSG